jgi:nucleoside-diphosphate-sugar epimerase
MKSSAKHIILGAGGAIGQTLANELISQRQRVKLVSRSGVGIPGTESMRADLTNAEETESAIAETAIVYLVAGIRYNASVWQQQWPVIMRNTVQACEAKNARLIFFDNVYPYGKVDGIMTESCPINPCSKKGEVRAEIAQYLLAEVGKGAISAIIARSADFYGPYASRTSTPFLLIIERLAKGKKATPLASAKTKHSYTYTVDCGKALFLLANEESAWNQVWHLPTKNPPPTGEEFIELVAGRLGSELILLCCLDG